MKKRFELEMRLESTTNPDMYANYHNYVFLTEEEYKSFLDAQMELFEKFGITNKILHDELDPRFNPFGFF